MASKSAALRGEQAALELDATRWCGIREALGLPAQVSADLLARAFTHMSFVREAGLLPAASNQRLEFVGDAVLDLVLVEHLYVNHPLAPEGKLTKMKASAVRSQTLARVATQMGLGQYLLLGHGEDDSGGREKPSLLEDCLEAVVGAVYLSTDIATTRQFVLDRFQGVLAEIENQQGLFDHKTALQELLQERTKQTPTYKTVETLGPPHDRIFVVEVSFRGQPIGTGRGGSKQAAQQAAARSALEASDGWLPQNGAPAETDT